MPDILTHTEDQKSVTTTSETPDIKMLGKWNWGAFLLTFFWALYHRLYFWAFLSIFPFIGFFVGIVLGFKGNTWAWKKDSLKNAAVFEDQQRKWKKISCIYIGIIGAVMVLLFSTVGYRAYEVNYGQTYVSILQALESRDELTRTVGTPLKITSFISFSEDFSRKRDKYDFTLKGSKNEGEVSLVICDHKVAYLSLTLQNQPENVLFNNLKSDANSGSTSVTFTF